MALLVPSRGSIKKIYLGLVSSDSKSDSTVGVSGFNSSVICAGLCVPFPNFNSPISSCFNFRLVSNL